MLNTYDNYIRTIVKCILWAIPAVTLFVDVNALYPYIAPRAFLFRILIGIALSLFLYLALKHKEYRPRLSYIHALFSIYLGITLVADILGINPFQSIWSGYEKMGGFISSLYFGIYFFLLSSVFKTKKDWRFLFISFVAVGCIHFFISFLQLPVVDLLSTYNNSGRAQGALGNPLYLTLFSTSLIFISIYLAGTSKTIESTRFFSFTSFLFFILGLLTGSRSTVFALAIVAIFSLPFLWRKILLKKKLSLLILMVVLITVSIGLLLNPRLISLEEKTISPRFAIWSVALDAVVERPLLGWGEESFLSIFSPHYKSSDIGENVWFDRPHNILLDHLVSIGIIGTLTYLIFISYIIFKILKLTQLNSRINIVWFLFFVSYFSQLMVSFETLNSGIILYAIIAFITREDVGYVEAEERFTSLSQNKHLGIFISLLCLVGVYSTNAPHYHQNILIMKNSIRSASLHPKTLHTEWIKTINRSFLGASAARERMSLVVNTLNKRTDISSRDIVNFTKASRLELLKEIEKRPLNHKLKVLLLNIDLIIMRRDPSFIIEIEKDIAMALKSAPQMEALSKISKQIYSHTIKNK